MFTSNHGWLNRKMRTSLAAIFMLLCMSIIINPSVHAQSKLSIQGRVINEANLGIPGVSIAIVGTQTGTITDADGNFQINVEKGNILSFSFIGFEPQEVTIENEQTLTITLIENNLNLEQVVVVGYGVQKKSDKTGAVMSISSKDMNQGVLQDPIQSIQGKIAGVNITKKGGDPNEAFAVQIRGTAGFKSGTSPLYVVDGVPGVDPTTVAPEDIESINVLKDASSAAIYGSRGATGVIIITTKKGNSGKSKLYYSGSTSFDFVENRLDLLNATQIREYATKNNLSLDDGGADTNWQDQIYQVGKTESHNLALSGGNEKSHYRASINYENFDGVVKSSGKERVIMRLNTTQKAINNRLTLSMNLSGTIENNSYINGNGNGPEALYYQTFTRNPTYPVFDQDGSFYEVADFENSNPAALIEQITNTREAKRYLGNIKADFDITEDLQFGVNGSYLKDDQQTWFFRPSYQIASSDGGYGKREYECKETKMIETTLKYNKSFEKHNLNLLAGYSWQRDCKTSFGQQGRDFLSDVVGANNMKFANDVLPQDIWSWKESNKLISFIGRAVYNYDHKYYLTATLRRDGSSRFGDNHEWGLFPSFSAAWNMHNESFLKDMGWLNQLKIRAGYGVTGNQEIGNYNDIARINTNGRTIDPTTGEKTLVIQQASNANPDLKWEENREVNIGLDFSVLDNRLTGSIDYYNKITSDVLAEYFVPVPPNRYNSIFANGGKISNEGIEINLIGNVIRKTDFTYKTTLSYSHNKQLIKSLSDSDFKIDYIYTSWVQARGMVGVATQYIEEGMELGTFYGWKNAGVNQNGEWLFYDKDGNLTTKQNNEDRQIIGQALPDFTLGWTNQFTYKRFDLGFSLRAVVGGDVLNATRMILSNPNLLPNRNALTESVEMSTFLKDGPKYSDYFIEDASFLRLDNITLGYTLNTQKVNWVDNLRLYVSANNLFTLTNYSGIDPESSYSGYENLGIDMYNVYPKTRTLMMGIKIGF